MSEEDKEKTKEYKKVQKFDIKTYLKKVSKKHREYMKKYRKNQSQS